MEFLGLSVFGALCGAPVAWLLSKFQADAQGPGREPHLDGLRGQLALQVLVFHFYRLAMTQRLGEADTSKLDPLQQCLGFNAVNLFFFLTAWLFWRRFAGKQATGWREFFVARVFRIGPGYFVTLLAAVAVCFALGTRLRPDLTWLPMGLLPLANPTHNHAFDLMTGQFWTLRYEWQFYIALPFLVRLADLDAWTARKWPRLRLAGAPWPSLLVFALLAFVDSHYSPFGFGLLATQCHRLWPEPAWAKSNWAAGLAIALGLVVLLTNPPFLVAASFLALGFYIGVCNPVVARLFSHPWLVSLGTVSYSTYLFHGVVLVGLDTWLNARGWTVDGTASGQRLVLGCLAILATTVCSTAIYLAVEHPMILYGKRVTSKLKSGTSDIQTSVQK